MEWEVIEDQDVPGQWRVEAINYDGDGEVYVAIFSGPKARDRAEEYADWKRVAARAVAA
jgi:hypothetical protein